MALELACATDLKIFQSKTTRQNSTYIWNLKYDKVISMISAIFLTCK